MKEPRYVETMVTVVMLVAPLAILLSGTAIVHAGKSEIRPLGGAPALFVDGRACTGLMFWTPAPTGGVDVVDGRLGMSAIAEGQQLATNRGFGRRFAVEVTLTIRNPARADASAGIKVQMARGNSCYYFGFGYYPGGNRVKLWKIARGAYLTWFTKPWRWTPRQTYRLRLEVDGNRIAGYVDGKLIAQKTDDPPLASGPLLLLAHHCEAVFDDLRVTSLPANALLMADRFDAPGDRNWRWSPSVGERIRAFARAGVHLFSFPVALEWKGPGQYDHAIMDEAMRVIVRADPKALAMPRIVVNAPDWWLRRHPEQVCRFASDPAGHRRVPTGRQSLSSAPWRREAGEALRRFVRHVERSEYADHVFAYHIAAGACHEWFVDWGAHRDYGVAHEQAFCQWLKTRYRSDLERFRKAWADPHATFDTATVPSPRRRDTGDFYEFFDPERGSQVPDYLAFHCQVVADSILHFARIVKAETRRRKLVAAFYGYYFFGNECTGGYFDSAQQALARVLASPDVDLLCAPHNYQERQPGGCCMPQLVAGSVRLHGKLAYDEDDTRTALTRPDAGYGRCATVADSIEVLRRNFASAMAAGGSLWWMEQGSGGWFHHPDILACIAKLQHTAAKLLAGDRSSAAQIAVIVAETACHHIRRSASLIDPLVADQMLDGVARIGAPVDTYLASDIAQLPDYKLYIVLNALYLTPDERDHLKQLRDKGHTILWVYAPGYVTETGLSVAAVSDLTGVRVRVEADSVRARLSLLDFTHPVARACGRGLQFGPHRPIGPIFFADDPKATVIGRLTGMRGLSHYEIDGGPGLAIRDFGTWKSVWCGVPNVPASLVRGIARWAGVHIYSDQDDAVYATPSLLAVHARHGARRRILLPKPLDVADAFTGQRVASGATEFRVDLAANQTGLWLLSAPQSR